MSTNIRFEINYYDDIFGFHLCFKLDEIPLIQA